MSESRLIQVQCGPCGAIVGVPGDDFRLVPQPGGHDGRFDCPLCGAHNVKPLSPTQVSMLREAGVEPAVPAARIGPPLTLDDLLDFALELAATDDVAGAAL